MVRYPKYQIEVIQLFWQGNSSILFYFVYYSSSTKTTPKDFQKGFEFDDEINSIVLGATLYNNKTVDVGEYVNVMVNFKHILDGKHFNLTCKSPYLLH